MDLTLAGALAAARSRSSWNDRLTAWERPASDQEEAQIERAATEVGNALAKNEWFRRAGVEVRPQGSYHNNTNVRLQADMDLHAWHPAIHTVYADNVHPQAANTVLGYTKLGVTMGELAATFRQQLHYELLVGLGILNVTPGKMAFTVRAVPGSRAPADVTPVFRLDYLRFAGFRNQFPIYTKTEGVWMLGQDGTERLNFPAQHHAHGIAKRANTQHRYKRVVRCLKRLRDELVTLGLIGPKQISSYFIECLLYLVPDEQYLHDEDRFDRLVGILECLAHHLADDAWCASALEVNGVKYLFHPAQSWTARDAAHFVMVAHGRLTAGPA